MLLSIIGVAGSVETRSLGDVTYADGTLNEKAVLFALLRRRQPDFIWDCRNDFVEWNRRLGSNVLLNKYQRSYFYTSKVHIYARRVVRSANYTIILPRLPSSPYRSFAFEIALSKPADGG